MQYEKKPFFILFLLLLYETFFEIIFVTLQIKTPGPCKIVALHAHTKVVVLPQTLSEEKLVKTNCYLLLLCFVSFNCVFYYINDKFEKRRINNFFIGQLEWHSYELKSRFIYYFNYFVLFKIFFNRYIIKRRWTFCFFWEEVGYFFFFFEITFFCKNLQVIVFLVLQTNSSSIMAVLRQLTLSAGIFWLKNAVFIIVLLFGF